jgi:hypothetical protein
MCVALLKLLYTALILLHIKYSVYVIYKTKYKLMFQINEKGHNKHTTLIRQLDEKDLKGQCTEWNKAKRNNSSQQADSKEFWRSCITLRITGFLDFVHRPVF